MPSPTHFRPSLIALTIAIASSYSIVSVAQEREVNGDLLEVLNVKGQSYRNTATKTLLEPYETPQGISITTKESLTQRGTQSVSEAIRYTSGTNTELRGGAISRNDFINIRGFNNQQNYYDGLQLLYNDWNLQPQIDTAAIEQVEVFKGPTSTLYGAMPPGGMVNLISKSPQVSRQNHLEITLGSDNKQEVQIDSTGPISDKINYRVIGLIRKKDGQALTSKEERIMIAPSLDLELSERTQLNLNLYYQQDPAAGVYSSLPSKGTVFDNVNGSLSPNTYAGDRNWETYDRDVLLFGYKLDHSINGTWSFLQNVRGMDATAYQENTYSTGLGEDERTITRQAYLTDESSKGITIDNQFSALFDVGAAEHNLLVGLDFLKLTSDIKYEDATAPSLDLFSPNHNQIIRSALSYNPYYSSDFTIQKEQVGLYLQDQIRLDQWVFIAGGRYDSFESTEKGKKYGSQTDTQVDQSQFTGRIGALYELNNGISPFISYAQSFEPVPGRGVNGKTYDTSTAGQWEAGIKYDSGNTIASLTTYQINKENVLTRDPNGSPYDLIQVGEVRPRGIELELQQHITSEVNLLATYTKQDVEVIKDNSGIQGNTPIWTPEQQLSSWLNYAPQSGYLAGATLGAGVRYIGKMELNSRNTDKVPSATLVDLSMGYDLAKLSPDLQGANIQLSISNAFNEEYYSCYDENNCWFGDERSFEVSARYDF